MATVDDGILCLIPARSGSRRIIDKNLQTVGGRSLLERSIATALEAFGRVLVSTDSTRYAEIARRAGADVPGLRPAELASDAASTDDVIIHVLNTWDDRGAEILVLVQATSPFTTPTDLHSVVAALRVHPHAACALTVTRVPATHGALLIESEEGARFMDETLASLPTQAVPPLAIPTGAAYAARVSRLRAGGALVTPPLALVHVDPALAIDIDDESDLARARELTAT